MANSIVSDLSYLVQSQEKIEKYLSQLEALVTIPLTVEDIFELPKCLLIEYFSVAFDLIEKASKANQSSLNILFKKRIDGVKKSGIRSI